MRKPRPIEFNIADIIESKRKPTKGQRFLVVDKIINDKDFSWMEPCFYIVYSFEDDDYHRLYNKLTTQHWKVVA